MAERELTQSELARQLGCDHAKVNEIINGKRSVTPDFALDLEKILPVPAADWVTMQAQYDLWRAQEKRKE